VQEKGEEQLTTTTNDMGISPWQSTCLVLLGMILAVWIDEGNDESNRTTTNCQSTQKVQSFTPTAVERFRNGETPTKTTVDYVTVLDAENERQERIKTIQTQAKTEWNNALESSNSGFAINYLRDPMGFIERFQNCVNHKDCYIMYQHVSKTGGTFTESITYFLDHFTNE
jgi:hypothetical protein